MSSASPLVSVCMITYNHEAYIEQAIKSVLAQKTNFKFELVIGNDCSTDGTGRICHEYANKYPEVINLLEPPKNLGPNKNFHKTYEACKGRYIAMLEGDDYWTDMTKLQTQFDFLESHPDYAICFHLGSVLDAVSGNIEENMQVKSELTFNDFATTGCPLHTMSVLFKNDIDLVHLFSEQWVSLLSGGDQLIYLYLTKSGRKAFCFQRYMGVYRKHSAGIWSGILPLDRISRTNRDVELYKAHLNLSFVQRQLLNSLFKKNIVSYIGYKLDIHQNPSFLKRSIVFFFNRLLFPFGTGITAGITANFLKPLIFPKQRIISND